MLEEKEEDPVNVDAKTLFDKDFLGNFVLNLKNNKNIAADHPLLFSQGFDRTNNDIEKRLRALNTIARLFSTAPYTAAVECADTPNAPLIVSISGKDESLNDKSAQIVVGEFYKFCMGQEHSLFETLHNVKNASLLAYINSTQQLAGSNEREIMHDLRKLIQYEEPEKIEKAAVIKNECLSTMFPDGDIAALKSCSNLLEKLNQAGDGRIAEHGIISTHNHQNALNQGGIVLIKASHVETWGQVEAGKYQNNGQTQQPVGSFNWGLANSTLKEPFCCASCTAERHVFMNNAGLEINVWGISESNFPPNGLTPSTIITDTHTYSIAYLEKLREQIQTYKLPLAKQELQKLTDELEKLGEHKSTALRITQKSKTYLEQINLLMLSTLPENHQCRLAYYNLEILKNTPQDEPTLKKIRDDCAEPLNKLCNFFTSLETLSRKITELELQEMNLQANQSLLQHSAQTGEDIRQDMLRMLPIEDNTESPKARMIIISDHLTRQQLLTILSPN